MIAFAALLAAAISYAQTPESAAIHALYAAKDAKLVVERSNVVGRYGAVLIRGGLMEGSPVTSPILVEHFSFGWQALELLNFQCRLDAHAIGAKDTTDLMRGFPKPRDDRPCKGMLKDAGSQKDVDAIRKQMRGPLTPSVVVSGEFALGQWYGGGGGDSLFKKRNGHWGLVTSGGGAMGVHEMRQFNVPRSAWCPFGIWDAKCPTKP